MRKGLWGLAVLLVFGFVLAGCSTDPKEEDKATKFEGSWKHDTTEINAVYVFTSNRWSFTSNGAMFVASGPLSGTFTFDDTSITFTATSGGSGSWTHPYTMVTENNRTEMQLNKTTNGNMLTKVTGRFTKQ